jgi:4-diphosphocytidyl-2C-methyl-D-erythritol kinase
MYELYDKTGRDFLTLAEEFCPDILKIENYLKKFKLKTKLSGSGPTVFCETNNYETAKKITENYQDFNGDIFICRPENKALKILKP